MSLFRAAVIYTPTDELLDQLSVKTQQINLRETFICAAKSRTDSTGDRPKVSLVRRGGSERSEEERSDDLAQLGDARRTVHARAQMRTRIDSL